MTQIQDRSRSDAPRLAVVRRDSSTTSTTREMLEAVRAQLMSIEKKLAEESARAEMRGRHRIGASEILACLPKAGGLTGDEILKTLPGLAKSSLWLHLRKLEKQGEVRFEHTSRGNPSGRLRKIVYHRDAMLT